MLSRPNICAPHHVFDPVSFYDNEGNMTKKVKISNGLTWTYGYRSSAATKGAFGGWTRQREDRVSRFGCGLSLRLAA